MMAVPISTKSVGRTPRTRRVLHARRRRQQRLFIGAFIICVIVGAVLTQNTITPQAKPNQNFTQPVADTGNTVIPSSTLAETKNPTATLEPTQIPIVNPITPTNTTSIVLPTQAQAIQYEKDSPILYYAQSGDSMGVLAVRFGVEVSDITSTTPLPSEGFIPEGQLLLIPARLKETSSTLKLFPDSEVVDSPSSIGFDTEDFIQSAGGFLSTYKESVYSMGYLSGAQIVKKVALEFSIHPRLLLALLEYKSGWVYGSPVDGTTLRYPMGFVQEGKLGLYKQLEMAAGIIETGYYGWREGRMVVLTFPDRTELRLASMLNCGSVGLMYFFSQTMNQYDWALSLYGEQGFLSVYKSMFGDPWATAQKFEPLFTPEVLQPQLILPFEIGVTWSMTVGPHAAWGAADVRAALDFAPPGDAPGCVPSNEWVVASAPGEVVRSENGVVVLDLDGDGYEQTGWNLIYMHIGTNARVPLGTWLETGDRVGHPSCEGGIATGTHTHMVRKYNGEWVPAEGPLSFDLQGWKAKTGAGLLSGWLIKGDEIVRASTVGGAEAQLTRFE